MPTLTSIAFLRISLPLAALREHTLVTIDLRALHRVSARSVAVFVACALEVKARGVVADGSKILLPTDPRVRDRLNGLDVLELLSGWPPGQPVKRKAVRGSRPCQVFRPTDDPALAARSLSLAMAEVCQTDDFARDATWYALNEIAQNVADHADARGGAVGIAEVTRGGDEVEVTIADFGVGIRASLERNPKHKSLTDLEALKIAVSPGGSGRVDPPAPAGLGLYFIQLMLRDNGGELAVRSAEAELVIGPSPSESLGLTTMSGTLVTLRFRTDKPVRLEPILPPS
jgi:hypothetical protein